MFSIGVALLGFYSFLLLIDELYFHRRRPLSRLERNLRALNTLLITAACGYALFVEYGSDAGYGFNWVAAASFVCFPLMDIDSKARVSGVERLLHGVLYMLHPIMLVLLVTCWRFIDGAGFFMRMALPLSTDNLRPLTWGYFGVLATLSVYHLVFRIFIRKPKSMALVVVQNNLPTVAESSENQQKAA